MNYIATLGATMIALFASAAQAQTTPAPAPAAPAAPTTATPAAPATTGAKFSLDTPLGELAANPAAKAVLDKDIPGLTTNEAFDTFKGASLNQVAPYSNGKLTEAMLAQVATDLAAIK
jgi:hypothetical protein